MRTIKLTRDEFRLWRANEGEDREDLKKALLEQNNGDTFRMMSPMGRYMACVKGRNGVVSNAPMGLANGAPSPEACICKSYAGTPKGEHHQVCVNRIPWEQSKGVKRVEVAAPFSNLAVTHMNVQTPIARSGPGGDVQHFAVPKQATVGSQHMQTGIPALKPKVESATARKSVREVLAQRTPKVMAPAPPNPHSVVKAPGTVPPDACDCAKFTKPTGADPNQHHFVCPHFEAWKIRNPTPTPTPTLAPLEPGQADAQSDELRDTEPPAGEAVEETNTVYVLADLETQLVLRAATSEEVDEARKAEAESGAPIIKVDETMYAVIEQVENAT
jgi:hypothetical protein